jgi:S1-C subfamily serine protease
MGDVILEVNSKTVTSPEELQGEIARARDNLQLKVGSPPEDKPVLTGRQVKKELLSRKQEIRA